MPRSHHRSNDLNIQSLSRHQECLNIPDVKIKKCCFREMHTQYRRLLPGQGQPHYPKTMQNGIFKNASSEFQNLILQELIRPQKSITCESNIKLFDIEYQMLELWGFSIWHIHWCGRLVSELKELSVGIFCLRYREL